MHIQLHCSSLHQKKKRCAIQFLYSCSFVHVFLFLYIFFLCSFSQTVTHKRTRFQFKFEIIIKFTVVCFCLPVVHKRFSHTKSVWSHRHKINVFYLFGMKLGAGGKKNCRMKKERNSYSTISHLNTPRPMHNKGNCVTNFTIYYHEQPTTTTAVRFCWIVAANSTANKRNVLSF